MKNFTNQDIAKTDRKIDEEVHKVYSVAEEEIKIVEGI
jgi:low affinity Fe/Cu permease